MFCGCAHPPRSTNQKYRGRAACQMLLRPARCCKDGWDHLLPEPSPQPGPAHAPVSPAVVRPWEGKNAGSSFFSFSPFSRESSAPASWAALLSLWLSSTSLGAPLAAVSTILAHYRRGTAWEQPNDEAAVQQAAANAQVSCKNWLTNLLVAVHIEGACWGTLDARTLGLEIPATANLPSHRDSK